MEMYSILVLFVFSILSLWLFNKFCHKKVINQFKSMETRHDQFMNQFKSIESREVNLLNLVVNESTVTRRKIEEVEEDMQRLIQKLPDMGTRLIILETRLEERFTRYPSYELQYGRKKPGPKPKLEVLE